MSFLEKKEVKKTPYSVHAEQEVTTEVSFLTQVIKGYFYYLNTSERFVLLISKRKTYKKLI